MFSCFCTRCFIFSHVFFFLVFVSGLLGLLVIFFFLRIYSYVLVHPVSDKLGFMGVYRVYIILGHFHFILICTFNSQLYFLVYLDTLVVDDLLGALTLGIDLLGLFTGDVDDLVTPTLDIIGACLVSRSCA